MMTAYIVLMVGGVNAVTYFIAGVTARHLLRGFALVWMESLVLLSLTFAFGAYFSTITNGVLALGCLTKPLRTLTLWQAVIYEKFSGEGIPRSACGSAASTARGFPIPKSSGLCPFTQLDSAAFLPLCRVHL